MPTTDVDRAISSARKRRGVAKASLTRLAGRLKDLESRKDDPSTQPLAQQMAKKLEELDADFRAQHLALIDLVEDEDTLAAEQVELDKHDDDLSVLLVRVRNLVGSACSGGEPHKLLSRRLSLLKKGLTSLGEDIGKMESEPGDECLIRQHEEQLLELKTELSDISKSLLSLDLEEGDELVQLQAVLSKDVFNHSLKLKRMISALKSAVTPTSSSTPDSKGVKLPKIDVPVFNGNILNWKSFWEQFFVAVHNRTDISDSEKLVYLRHSVKDGSAKGVIEGLSRSGEHYAEAVECLTSRYDRPRLIHQAHVRKILEVPALKEGSGRELRHLHDTVLQHLRALKAMGYEPSGPFITSALELKLDTTTTFEWQRHSHSATDVPHFRDLLEFIDMRAQASESSVPGNTRRSSGGEARKPFHSGKPVTSLTAHATAVDAECVLCKPLKHPLYACSKFKGLPYESKISTVKDNNLCINCLKPVHFLRQCKSLYRCRVCQKPHHSLLHAEAKPERDPVPPIKPPETPVPSLTATKLNANALLMTCQVVVSSPDGVSVRARALLDSASSASFVSERLVNFLHLSRSRHVTRISGIAGLSHDSPSRFISDFVVSPRDNPARQFHVSAVVVPKVTCDLPVHPTPLDPNWSHIAGLSLADPQFGSPGAIDLLLGVDLFVETLLHGRRQGPPGTPRALETEFGWVLAGATNGDPPASKLVSHHVALLSGDDLLRRFWEVEESPLEGPVLSVEEKAVLQHFKSNHSRTADGRFVVPLPRKTDTKHLGESRSQAVRRFLTMERSLHSRNQFAEFASVVTEYFALGHAERIPVVDMQKPVSQTFYMPMHAVRKETSSTTKVRVVFDASAKSSTGASLNDTLMVGPNIHPPLFDVLLRFRLHQIALTADVSKMYRAVQLAASDRDYHRFVWRNAPSEPLIDYRMTRVTFGVSASSFAANMCVSQNASDFAAKYPRAARVVNDSIYVDDCLTGAETIEEATCLQIELHNLFDEAKFLLRKWNSSEPSVLQHVPSELRESHFSQTLVEPTGYSKTLGIEWNAKHDSFRLTISDPPAPSRTVTKRLLTSDVAKTFDALGWFSPTIIKAKVLLQKMWERHVDWDQAVPDDIRETWWRWRSELPLLSGKHLSRCLFPKGARTKSIQAHGFCDASETAFAAVVYLRVEDVHGSIHPSLVMSKTRVAPLKRLTIPRLELCGASLLARVLSRVIRILNVPLCDTYAWTDSTVVLSWLTADPRRFKTYVGNRVSSIVELIPPRRWRHVSGADNPADCASRGLFPSELLQHNLWWDGPDWLRLEPQDWPRGYTVSSSLVPEEEKEICLSTTIEYGEVIPLARFSSLSRLLRVTAWTLRFIQNCQARRNRLATGTSGPLAVEELTAAETLWLSNAQWCCFSAEVESLKKNQDLPRVSCLRLLHPFLDRSGLLRVGGRIRNSPLDYSQRHPVILHGQHPLTKLIVTSEHVRLLHAGATLVRSSLSRRYHIVKQRIIIRTIVRACIVCRRVTARARPQIMGQLPLERVTPDLVFNRVGIDYAGPLYLKLGHVRKPTIVKAYVCVFVSLSVKAVHLELVSDLTTPAFIACLRRFISRRGKPSSIWSDHGSNFVGASRELSELARFLQEQRTAGDISDFCSSQGIDWSFIPEHAPHFGGLWESAVRSMKTHLKHIVGNSKLTFEELYTILTQIESCLNSRPLVVLPNDEDVIEALTPGHFLVGRPLESLPDPPSSYRSMPLLRRWELCQTLVRHFWQRWSSEYISSLRKFAKWHTATRNARIGDIVLLQEDGLVPCTWPLGRITSVHPGKDGIVRVVTVRTATGTYKRPITKVAPLLSVD